MVRELRIVFEEELPDFWFEEEWCGMGGFCSPTKGGYLVMGKTKPSMIVGRVLRLCATYLGDEIDIIALYLSGTAFHELVHHFLDDDSEAIVNYIEELVELALLRNKNE